MSTIKKLCEQNFSFISSSIAYHTNCFVSVTENEGKGFCIKFDKSSRNIIINIDSTVIDYYFSFKKNKDKNFDQIAVKLFTHEALHILLNHFGSKYENYDRKLLNIAGDLEINSYLDLGFPFLNPVDFSLPLYQTTDWYYNELKEKMDSEGNLSSYFEYNSFMEKNELNETVSNFDNSCLNDFKNINDSIINSSFSFGKTCSKELNNFSSKVDNSPYFNSISKILNNKKIKEMILALQKHENSVKIAATKKTPSFQKLNNRRDSSDLILPGKKTICGGVNKTFDTYATLFLDFSASTFDFIDRFKNIRQIDVEIEIAKYLAKKTNCNVAFYSDDLIKIESADRQLETPDYLFAKGTDLHRSVRSYMKDNDLHRLYVITDGYDNFDFINYWKDMGLDERPKIWKVNGLDIDLV